MHRRGCRFGLSLTANMTWIQVNRAHALMFLGRVEEARSVYLQYRGEIIRGEKDWEAGVNQDFDELTQAGLTHPLMEEIKTILATRK
jgi:hypothetical protein